MKPDGDDDPSASARAAENGNVTPVGMAGVDGCMRGVGHATQRIAACVRDGKPERVGWIIANTGMRREVAERLIAARLRAMKRRWELGFVGGFLVSVCALLGTLRTGWKLALVVAAVGAFGAVRALVERRWLERALSLVVGE